MLLPGQVAASTLELLFGRQRSKQQLGKVVTPLPYLLVIRLRNSKHAENDMHGIHFGKTCYKVSLTAVDPSFNQLGRQLTDGWFHASYATGGERPGERRSHASMLRRISVNDGSRSCKYPRAQEFLHLRSK